MDKHTLKTLFDKWIVPINIKNPKESKRVITQKSLQQRLR